jgi:hypothetical protein
MKAKKVYPTLLLLGFLVSACSTGGADSSSKGDSSSASSTSAESAGTTSSDVTSSLSSDEGTSSETLSSSATPGPTFSEAVAGIDTSLDAKVSSLSVSSLDTKTPYEALYRPYVSGSDDSGNTYDFLAMDSKTSSSQQVDIYSNDLLTNSVKSEYRDMHGKEYPEYDVDSTTYCYFDADDVYSAIQVDHLHDNAVSGGIMSMPADWAMAGMTVEEGKTSYIYTWGIANSVVGNYLTDADTTYSDTFAFTSSMTPEGGYTFQVSYVNPAFSTVYDYFGLDSTSGMKDGPISFEYSATISVDGKGLLYACDSTQSVYMDFTPMNGFSTIAHNYLEVYHEVDAIKTETLVPFEADVPTNPDAVPVKFYGYFYTPDGKNYYWLKLMSGFSYVYVYTYSETKGKPVIDGGATDVPYVKETDSVNFTYTSKSTKLTYNVSLSFNEAGDLVVTSTVNDQTTVTVYLTAEHYAAQ